MNNILKIGLTGGLGSGKSTVCKYFAELGIPVIDADLIAKNLLLPGHETLNKIIDLVGNGYLSPDGTLNRKALRKRIFEDNDVRSKIENLLHPLVYKEIDHQLKTISDSYVIISIPLLLETDSNIIFDRILVIDAPEKNQIDRASKRDNENQESIIKIINSQISRSDRLEAADDIIYNDKDKLTLKKQVEIIHKYYSDINKNKYHSENAI